jgi:predicted tellurium resistance membrane protein TerC
MTSLFSAAAGGAVGILAGLAAALVASLGARRSAGAALFGALRAEALRLGLAFAVAWLVLANYPEVAVAAFLATLVVTMLIFPMAFFVRDY